MPRHARIDAAGALHHIIVRGIERSKIFKDDKDREDLLDRLGLIVAQTGTCCYAWSLMSNHFHLLLKTGHVPVATVMRRLLTGYAVRFNRRYRRSGHLFQNRYKSILCQEDAYLTELVRYIHLNPLRAKIVRTLKELDRYRYSGHAVVMGKRKAEWQDTDRVLSLFDKKAGNARRLYWGFVEKGIEQGKRPDLVGGGLLRSAGGWTAVKSLRKAGVFLKSDERILGDSDFVESVLSEASEKMERKYELAARGVTLEKLIQLAAELFSVPPEKISGPEKTRVLVQARSLVCYWAVSELGMTMKALSKKMNIALPTVSLAAKRGEKIAADGNLSLVDLLNA